MLTGVDLLVKWAMKRKDLAKHIIKIANDFTLDKIRMYADIFGAERLLPFVGHASATNQIIGPKVFEEFCLPYILEQYKAILAMGVKHIACHICGYQAQNYSMWPQVPLGDPGIVSVAHDVDAAWPTPLASVSKLFPNDILYGNVEPAKIHVGTPAEVYKLSRDCIEVGKKHPSGFILAPGCEMPPNAPAYNVWTMTKAVEDFGYY